QPGDATSAAHRLLRTAGPPLAESVPAPRAARRRPRPSNLEAGHGTRKLRPTDRSPTAPTSGRRAPDRVAIGSTSGRTRGQACALGRHQGFHPTAPELPL